MIQIAGIYTGVTGSTQHIANFYSVKLSTWFYISFFHSLQAAKGAVAITLVHSIIVLVIMHYIIKEINSIIHGQIYAKKQENAFFVIKIIIIRHKKSAQKSAKHIRRQPFARPPAQLYTGRKPGGIAIRLTVIISRLIAVISALMVIASHLIAVISRPGAIIRLAEVTCSLPETTAGPTGNGEKQTKNARFCFTAKPGTAEDVNIL